jgi:RNA polymerase sigma-70 factor (ECF subfamily)
VTTPAEFAALVAEHRPAVVRCAALLVGDVDEAESIAQEAFARALARLSDYRPDTPFVAWVRGFAFNLCKQHLRTRTRHATPTDPATLNPPDPDGRRNGVLSGILRDELSAKLWLAVGRLPEAYREAVVLHYVEGMDYAAMAELTGAAAGTLRARALRGRTLLQGELGPVVDTWLRAGNNSDEIA